MKPETPAVPSHRITILAAAGALVGTFAVLTAPAAAQRMQATKDSLMQRVTPLPTPPAQRATGLSGVRAELPPAIQQLGGVKAEIPHPIRLGQPRVKLPSPGHGGPALPARSNPIPAGRRITPVQTTTPIAPQVNPGLTSPVDRFGHPFLNRNQLSPIDRNGVGGGGGGRNNFGGDGLIGNNFDGDAVRGSFNTATGLHVDGRFTDDHFRLQFHLGSGLAHNDFHGRGFHNDFRQHRHDNFLPLGYYYPYIGYGAYNDGYYEQPVAGYASPQPMTNQPAAPQPPAAPPTPPTTLEKADIALYNGQAKDAVTLYRDHLKKTPDDALAMRSLAVALIEDGRIKEGVAVMGAAYDKAKAIARIPLDQNMLSDGARGFQDLLMAVVPFANRMKSDSGWLTVAVVMQSQGRKAQALKMLAKAKAAGLDEGIASELEAELSQ